MPAEALYLPFEAGPHLMAMGLVARHPDELIELDDHYPAEMAERRALLDGRNTEVFAATAGSDEARQETLDRIAGLLPTRHPRHFGRDGSLLHNRLPQSGFVLFTIRVHTYSLSRVAAQPGAAARLALAVRAMPEAMAAYKSLPPFKTALLSFLDGSTAEAGVHDACV